jgi:ABC-type transporter Mla subunit MlaD
MITPNPRYASAHQPEQEAAGAQTSEAESAVFDQLRWDESRAEGDVHATGGRAVLGYALLVLAVLWIGYTAWSAGRALAAQPLSSPQIAQWVAIAAGPLALLGLVWLMFGRTRRKEAERFTRSVVAMRSEARALEGLLGVLSQRISDSRSELGAVAENLMRLGDEATARLGAVTGELGQGSERLAHHAGLFDRAAEAARNELGVILDDLPRAEQHARNIAEQLRASGADTAARTAELDSQVAALSERTREADQVVAAAAQRLVGHLTHIESAGAAAAARVGEAESSFSTAVDSLLDRTALTLDEIRGGIDAQSAAVTALVEQSSVGIGRAGVEAAQALCTNVASANVALEFLSARVAEQERSSLRITSEIDRALSELEQRFTALAETGDDRAARFSQALARSRAELDSFAEASGGQDQAISTLAERTQGLRAGIEQLAANVREELGEAVQQSERLAQSAQTLRPEIEWLRDAAGEASERIAASGEGIAEQQDRFAALLAALDDGVGTAENRLVTLSGAISDAQAEAARLSAETGPALVQAMVQVREAAAHAAQRAREAIASIVPESAESLSQSTREALERVIRESVEERLSEVEAVAARAVESARSATERLTDQMLSLGQSATALEQHVERQQAGDRERASEEFARRVSMLMDSMHSASIDVGKILSDEVDEKAWESYLKGNRGVFTRRAVRLLDGSESRAIRSHYEADGEFQQSVNRYVHDFEAMLRRVLAERDGGMIAVTLMSSDMGKLYAALAQSIDRRR